MSKGRQLKDACLYGRLDEVKGLIDEGVDVDSSDWSGQTSLMYAARNGHVEIVRLLLDNGANIHNKDDTWRTALHYAAYYGYDEAVRLLIGRGANLHVKSDWGETPLDEANAGHHCSTAAIIKANIKSTKGKNDYYLISTYIHVNISNMMSPSNPNTIPSYF